MNGLDFQFIFLVLLFIIVLVIFFTRHLRIRYKYNPDMIPIPPDSIPEILKGTFNSVTDVFKKNNLEPVGDFKNDYQKKYHAFYRLFKDHNEKIHGFIFAAGLSKGYFVTLELLTEFQDAPSVVSLNERRYLLPVAEGTYRQFPGCLPGDLVRLHKEYTGGIKSERKTLPDDKDLPAHIISRQQQNYDYLVQKRIFEKAKEEGYHKFTFRYLFVIFFREMARFITFNPRPYVVKDKAYTRGFNHTLGSRLHKNINVLPGRKRKPVPAWVWAIAVIAFIILMVLPFSIFEFKNRIPPPSARVRYSDTRDNYNRKLFTFGEVPAAELSISLNRIETWLSEKFSPGADGLNPGLTHGQIDKLLEYLPIKPVEELYTLYTWRNGQKETVGNRFALFFPWYRFMPLEEAVKAYRKMQQDALKRKDYGMGEWKPYYFPILEQPGYYYVVLCGGDKPGAVLKRHDEASLNEIAYPGIAGLMQETAECFDTGAFYISDEGFMHIDREKQLSILKRYHPAMYPAHFNYKSRPLKTTTKPDGSREVSSMSLRGFKRVERFDARNRLVEKNLYVGGKLVQTITSVYDDQGRITQRIYKKGDKVFQSVKWDYKPGNEVNITIDSSGNILEVKAKVDDKGNWSVQVTS